MPQCGGSTSIPKYGAPVQFKDPAGEYSVQRDYLGICANSEEYECYSGKFEYGNDCTYVSKNKNMQCCITDFENPPKDSIHVAAVIQKVDLVQFDSCTHQYKFSGEKLGTAPGTGYCIGPEFVCFEGDFFVYDKDDTSLPWSGISEKLCPKLTSSGSGCCILHEMSPERIKLRDAPEYPVPGSFYPDPSTTPAPPHQCAGKECGRVFAPLAPKSDYTPPQPPPGMRACSARECLRAEFVPIDNNADSTQE